MYLKELLLSCASSVNVHKYDTKEKTVSSRLKASTDVGAQDRPGLEYQARVFSARKGSYTPWPPYVLAMT